MATYKRQPLPPGINADDFVDAIKNAIGMAGAHSVEVVRSAPGSNRLELIVWFHEHCDLSKHTRI